MYTTINLINRFIEEMHSNVHLVNIPSPKKNIIVIPEMYSTAITNIVCGYICDILNSIPFNLFLVISYVIFLVTFSCILYSIAQHLNNVLSILCELYCKMCCTTNQNKFSLSTQGEWNVYEYSFTTTL